MNDDNKTLKKKDFYEWVENHYHHLENRVSWIYGAIFVIVPLLIAILIIMLR